MTTKQRREVLDPGPKLSCRDSLTIIALRIVENTKDVVGQEFSDRSGHARETMDEEVDGIPKVQVERTACSFSRIGPGIVVVQPSRTFAINTRSGRNTEKQLTY
jgi:hypothetical protein